MGALGRAVDPGFERRAEAFLEEVARWSRVWRLTGYRTPREWVEHLLLDSLLFLLVLPEPASPLLDIGSGAGAPGLVLKLARPAWEVSLVEANRRRVNFLRQVARRLALRDVEVWEGRAEALAREPAARGRFRTVTLRAVAPPLAAASLAQPFLRADGHVVLGLGPAGIPPIGEVREIPVPWARARLQRRRRFLIIRATEIPSRVPRGTQPLAPAGSSREPRPDGAGVPRGT